MTARLATAADAAYITKAAATIGQRYSPEWALELLTDSRYIVVADDDGGYFWVARDTPDKTLVRAGYAIGKTTEQVKALYKVALTEALLRWPQANIVEARQKPSECQPEASARATDIAKMTKVATEEDGTEVYRVTKAKLVVALK